MSKPNIYVQCILIKNGTKKTTSFIPKKYAKKGSILRLRKENGEFENGWVVESTHSSMEYKAVSQLSREHLNHRNRTDI